MAEAQYAHNHIINPETGFLENPAYSNDFDSEKKKTFLDVFLNNGMGLYRTCRKLGMSCSTVHKHYQLDPVFREKFDEVRREYGDELEATSRVNALNPRSVIERIFQLKAIFPEKYGDSRTSNALNITINIDDKTLEMAKKRDQILDVEEIPQQLDNQADTSAKYRQITTNSPPDSQTLDHQ